MMNYGAVPYQYQQAGTTAAYQFRTEDVQDIQWVTVFHCRSPTGLIALVLSVAFHDVQRRAFHVLRVSLSVAFHDVQGGPRINSIIVVTTFHCRSPTGLIALVLSVAFHYVPTQFSCHRLRHHCVSVAWK